MNTKEAVAARVAQHQQNSKDGVARERREGGGREREDGRASERASARVRTETGSGKKGAKKGKERIPALFCNSKRPPTQISAGFFFSFSFLFCGDHPQEDLAKNNFFKQNNL
jgi:hypothetical protein